MSDHRGLLSLSMELLQMISNDLHPQDVKVFRAANKQLQAAASPYLFRRVYIALRPQTCAIFEKIVCHPVFSQNVTEILFDASQFLVNHYVLRKHQYEGDGQCVYRDDKRCRLEYERLFCQQECLHLERRVIKLLAVASSRLRSLESFKYTNWQIICDKNQSRWYLNKGPMSWDLDMSRVCLPAVSGWSATPRQLPLDKILSSFTSSQIKHFVQELNAVNWSRGAPSHLNVISLLSTNSQFDPPPGISQGIITFKAAIRWPCTNFHSGPPSFNSAFLNLIASFSDLCHLELSASTNSRGERFFLENHYWPHLCLLSLTGELWTWTVLPEVFLTFLARHAKTLRHLHVEGFDLVDTQDTWVDVIDGIRRHLCNLVSLRLGLLWEKDNPVAYIAKPKVEGDKSEWMLDTWTECGKRRQQLDILQQWVVLEEPYGLEPKEQRAAFELVRSEWFSDSLMSTWEDENCRKLNDRYDL